MALQLEHLRSFRLVVEHGGFTRAAEVLGLRQSTVSFQMKALERALDARLLDRNKRTVRPTPAGRVVLRYARRILALADETEARVRAEQEGGAGRVSLAVSTISAEYLLPPLLARFRRTHPGVHVAAEVSDSAKAARALLDEACDLALVGARLDDRRIEWAPFARDEIVLAGRTDEAPPSLSRAALALAPLVLREPGSGTRDAIEKLLPPHVDDPGGAPRLQVGSTEAARRCLLEGLGLSFISRTAVGDDVGAGRLRIVRYPGTPFARTFYVGRLRTVTLPAAARALLEAITPRGQSRS